MSIKVTQHSFAGGQLDRALLGGRQDLQKYYTGATSIENYIVQRQGCLTKRPGTDFCLDVSTLFASNTLFRLTGFVFEETYGYAILFTPGTITVYDTNSDTAQTITTSPYLDYLDMLGFCQIGDTLYICSQFHPPHKLIRAADGTFSLVLISFLNTLPAPAIAALDLTGETSGTADRTIYYCATAVHETGESLPSTPLELSYKSPWASGQVVTVVLTAASTTPLYYRIYKKNQNYFGLIGTTTVTSLKLSESASACTCTPKTTNATSIYLWKVPLWATAAAVKDVFMPAAMTDYGWKRGAVVCASGNIELTLTKPIRFSRVRIGIGYAASQKNYYHPTNTALWSSWKACLYATKAVKHSVTVTYEDAQNPVTASSALFAQISGGAAIDSVFHSATPIGNSPDSASEATAYTTLAARGHLKYVDIDLPAGETRAATKILIKGWADDAMTVACTGDITVTPSAADTNGYKINAYAYTNNPMIVNGVELFAVDGSVLTFTDDYITPNIGIGIPKQTDLFLTSGNYPGLVSLYQQRLVLASTINNPSKYWMSRPGNFLDFSENEIITESDPIIASLPLTKGPRIRHLATQRDLHMFCESSEWLVRAISGNTLSYKTITAQMQSASGCSMYLPPIMCGTSMLFVEKSGRSVREYKYDYVADGFAGRDISVMASSIFEGKYITSWAYQQHPDSILWCVTSDFRLVGLTYMPEEDVYAWFECKFIQGTSGADAIIRAICATEAIISYNSAHKTSEIFLLISRFVAAVGDVHSIERMSVYIENKHRMGSDANLDCKRQFTATEGQTIPEGQIAVGVRSAEIVTALEAEMEYVTGYPITAQVTTIHPEIQNAGTIQNTIKSVVSADIRVQRSAELFLRLATQEETDDQPVPELAPQIDIKGPEFPEQTWSDVHLAEGDFHVMPLQANSTDGRVTITDKGIFGSTILSVSTNLSIQPTDGEPG